MTKYFIEGLVVACVQRYLNLGEWVWWAFGGLTTVELLSMWMDLLSNMSIKPSDAGQVVVVRDDRPC